MPQKKWRSEIILKWGTLAIALGGLSLGILNGMHSRRSATVEKALKVQELVGEATDLIHFGAGDDVSSGSIPPRELGLAGRKIAENLVLEPENVEGLRLGAIYLFHKAQFDDCIKRLKTAICLDPTAADLYLLLGRALSEKGQHQQAVGQFQRAIAVDPTLVNAHIGLGVSYLNLKRHEESTVSFERAGAVDPNSTHAHFNLGYIYYFRGRLEKAREEFCEVIAGDRDFPTLNEYMAKLLYYQGKIANLNEYDPRSACPRLQPRPPRIITPFFVILAGPDEETGEDSVVPMWRNLATGELKPIGEWWE